MQKPTAFRHLGLLFLVLAARSLAGETPRQEPAHNCLWRVSGESNCVYLLGSIHLLKSEHYPVSVPISKAFLDSRVLVLEIDLGGATNSATQVHLFSKGMLSGTSTLQRILSPATFDLASRRTKELGLDISLFNGFKPWYFVMTLTMLKLQKLGFDPMDGIDWHFYRQARQYERKVIGLETLDEQIGLFDSVSVAEQEQLVQQTLRDFDVVDKDMNRIYQAWRTGDVAGLEKTLLKSFEEYPRIYNLFVVNRNRKWLPRFESFLKDSDNYLVVVGAGHLAGKDSLVKLLQKKRYKVEQL